MRNILNGLRVFVVEDDPLVAIDVALSLQDAGAGVYGPYPTCQAATEALPAIHISSGVDLAILDLELRDETSEPVAKLLADLAIPIIFHTGFDVQEGSRFASIDAPVMRKPTRPEILIEQITLWQRQDLSATATPRSTAAR